MTVIKSRIQYGLFHWKEWNVWCVNKPYLVQLSNIKLTSGSMMTPETRKDEVVNFSARRFGRESTDNAQSWSKVLSFNKLMTNANAKFSILILMNLNVFHDWLFALDERNGNRSQLQLTGQLRQPHRLRRRLRQRLAPLRQRLEVPALLPRHRYPILTSSWNKTLF